MAQVNFSDLVNGTVPDASDFNTPLNALKNAINNGLEADNIATGAITTAKIASDAVTSDKIDDDGDFGQFTGAWRFANLEATFLSLPETTAPTVAASEGALYTKDTGGQPELFFREESDGDEVQLTSGGALKINTNFREVVTGSYTGNGGTQTITIGFSETSRTPKMVIIYTASGSTVATCFLTNRANGFALSDGSNQTTSITGVGANSFSLGSYSGANTGATTYYFFAIG